MRKLLLVAGGAMALLSLTFITATPKPAHAGDVVFDSANGEFNLHVVSIKERRFRTVVLQHFDYSCGAAAVATLLTYSYQRETPEEEPFVKMIEVGDRESIQRVGFSMLDMKNYLEAIGFHPLGVKLDLDGLQKLRVPGVALIEYRGYKHFVVIRAVDSRRVLLADPALGMQIVERQKFETMWDGVILLIRDDPKIAQANFNEEAFWAVIPPAPVGQANVHEGMSIFSQNLPLHNILIIAF